jgi:hypothetical protein
VIAEEKTESVQKLVTQHGCWVPEISLAKGSRNQPLKLMKYGECVLVKSSDKFLASK